MKPKPDPRFKIQSPARFWVVAIISAFVFSGMIYGSARTNPELIAIPIVAGGVLAALAGATGKRSSTVMHASFYQSHGSSSSHQIPGAESRQLTTTQ